jgi:hypothetical protein
MKNMNDFKNFKKIKKNASLITEDVIQIGDVYRVRGFDVPVTLISKFKAKAKDSGNDISGKFADTELAEFITKYVQNQYLIIDNLPMDVLGDDYVSVQVQPQTQVQEPQVQEPQSDAQNSQAQQTAQEIPAQTQPQPQPQTPPQTQSQTQPQNTQNTQEI